MVGVLFFKNWLAIGRQFSWDCAKRLPLWGTAKRPIPFQEEVLRIGSIGIFLTGWLSGGDTLTQPVKAQTLTVPTPSVSTCPAPALSQLNRHRIQSGETLESIAARYNLIPATLIGFNSRLRSGSAPVGTEIVIPPYNGIRVDVPTGTSLRDLARRYNVRPDVLFEINGCQAAPRTVFVPGVNWSPNPAPTTANSPIDRYPLPSVAPILTRYGWQLNPASGRVVFQSGVNLEAAVGTPVYAAGSGTIAFAGNQAGYGNLVVINHSQGLQTRYAHLQRMNVRVGQTVRVGTTIGTVGYSSGSSVGNLGGDSGQSQPYLTFEVRSNSDLGWVAQDPGNYLRQLRSGGRR